MEPLAALRRRLASCSVAWACSRHRSPSRPPSRWWQVTGSSRHEVVGELEHLIDQSLVQMDDLGTHPRFSLLETVRQFARRALDAAGETDGDRRPPRRLLPSTRAGTLAAVPRRSGGPPRHGRCRVRGSGGDAQPPRAPRHAGGARGGGHGLPARHRRAARRRGGRRSATPSRPGWSRPACSAGTSTCGSPWPTRRCRTTCRSRWRPPRRPSDPELGALRDLLGGLGAGAARRRAETRWRATTGLGIALGDAGEEHFSRTHWAVGRPPPRDGPPHGGHPALAAIRRGHGVHAVQRHGLVGGDTARPGAG